MQLPLFQDPNQNFMLMQTRWSAILNALLRKPAPQWTSYTPTTQGFGTIKLGFCRYQVTDDLCAIQSYFLSGTPTADPAQFGLPVGLTVDLPTNFSVNPELPGQLMCGRAFTNNISATFSGELLPQVTQGLTFLSFGIVQNNTNPFTLQLANAFCASGKIMAINATVPIVV